MAKQATFAIQPVSTVFDLAGMISACLPDASVLPAFTDETARRYQRSIPLYRQHHPATTSAVKHAGRFKNGISHK
jgi:hypothetical protein